MSEQLPRLALPVPERCSLPPSQWARQRYPAQCWCLPCVCTSSQLSRKFSGSARFRVLIDRAQQTLDEKNLSFAETRNIREHLGRLLDMLTAATVPSQPVSLLHELALRTVSLPQVPVSAEAALIVSPSCPALECLPTSVAEYTDEVL